MINRGLYFFNSISKLQASNRYQKQGCRPLISKILDFMMLLLHFLLFTVHCHVFLEGFALFLFLLLLFFIFLLLLLSDHLLKCLWIIIVNVLVDACLQSFHQFLFYFLLNVGGNQGFGLSYPVSLFSFLFNWHKFFLSLQFHFSHLDQHLSKLSQSLFAFMNDERRPIDQLFIDLFQGLLIIFIQLHLFPQFIRQMSSFSRLHKEVTDSFFFPDCCILRIGQRT